MRQSITLKSGKKWPLNTSYLGDCLDFMRELPDKCIDLCLTDPPYGINATKSLIKAGKWKRDIHEPKEWDNKPPESEIFNEIFRISKNQIIWGGNYFIDNLKPTPCFLVWDKKLENGWLADCELAWTSFKTQTKKFTRHHIEDYNCGEKHIHPTQKPVKLIKWCLENYSKKDMIIFDPFLGSFTTSVACHSHGLNWLGCEKDPDYFKAGMERYETECLQIRMEF